MKYLIQKLATIIFIILLFFTNCTPKNDNVLKVGYIPIAECLQLYVAKDMGYFEEEGLIVELYSASGGPYIMNDLLSGAIDVGFSNVVSLIKQNDIGNPMRSAFGATYESENHQNHAIFVRKDSGIDDYKDLESKRISINAPKNIEELMLRKFLLENGIEDSSFNILPFPQMLPMLDAGNLDAVCIVEPFIKIAKSDTNNKKYLVNQYLAGSQSDKVLVATYAALNGVIEEKQGNFEKFVTAMTRATDFIENHKRDAVDIILKYTKIPEEIVQQIGLSEFDDKVDPEKLDEIIALMKQPQMNFLKRNDGIEAENLVWQAKK